MFIPQKYIFTHIIHCPNIFFKKNGIETISKFAQDFIDRLLDNATEICLVLNSSVNSYRRLDPNFEAPNQIKCSAVDRSAMIRIPAGNEGSTRIEVRSVGSDTNPYLLIFTLLKVGLEGPRAQIKESKRQRTRVLPGNIHDALRIFKASDLMSNVMGEDAKDKYAGLKEKVADRAHKELGKSVKKSEVIYHHEVTNQYLWNQF